MTNTFEEINEKRDIIEKDWHPFHVAHAKSTNKAEFCNKSGLTYLDTAAILYSMLVFESHLQEIRALLEERDDLVKTIAELQSQLDAVNLSNKASLKAGTSVGDVEGCEWL